MICQFCEGIIVLFCKFCKGIIVLIYQFCVGIIGNEMMEFIVEVNFLSF